MRRVLLDVVLNVADGTSWVNGWALAGETWSWLGDQDPQSRQGGFAGWTVDGSPVWAGGRGTSQMVLRNYGQALATVLPTAWPERRAVALRSDCSRAIGCACFGWRARGDFWPVAGDYRVEFASGNALGIHSDGELFLLNNNLSRVWIARNTSPACWIAKPNPNRRSRQSAGRGNPHLPAAKRCA